MRLRRRFCTKRVVDWTRVEGAGLAGATAILRPDGSFQPSADPARYARLVSDGDSAKQAAVIGATAAALTAAAGWVPWLLSREPPPAPGLAFRF